LTSILIAIDRDSYKEFAERVLSDEPQNFDKSLLKALWDRSTLARNLGADEVTIGITSGIQPLGVGFGGSAEVKWTLKKDLDQYTPTEIIAKIDKMGLLPLRPVDELVSNLNTQASQSVPIERLIFPGQPLLVQGTLRLDAQSTQLSQNKVRYRIDSSSGSIAAIIKTELAARLKYCDNRAVKVMGLAEEEQSSESSQVTGTNLGIMLSTVAIWLTDE